MVDADVRIINLTDPISRWLKMLSQQIVDTLALEVLWHSLIMVDEHDLSIVCYMYVEYNKSS